MIVLICHLAIADVVYGAIWSKHMDVDDGNEVMKLPIGDRVRTSTLNRFKRETSSGDSSKLSVNSTTLKDRNHKEAIVHWSGTGSNVRDVSIYSCLLVNL